jgi:hypothetical protein
MASQDNSSLGLIGLGVLLGVSIISSVAILKEPIASKNQYEIKQEGPVFIRFSKRSGELCYTGLAPNGKFATQSWICMDGENTKEGEGLKLPSQEESGTPSKSSNKKNNK